MARRPFVPVPQTVQMGLHGTYGSDNWTCVIHFGYSNPPTDADLINMAQTALNAWGTHISPLCSNQVTLHSCKVVDLASNLGSVGEVANDVPGEPTSTTPLPASTAMVISKQTQRRYQGGHGRTYLPIGDQTQLNDPQHWKTTFAQSAINSWSAFISAIKAVYQSWAGNAIEVLVHRYAQGTPLANPYTEAVISAAAQELLGTQRRRVRPRTNVQPALIRATTV
jgi:hypothetical protein